MKIKNVVSICDGISGGQLALVGSKIEYDSYYAFEIDKFATAVTQHHFPSTIQMGDVNNICDHDIKGVDLLMGGTPCQGFSFAGKQLNFNDPRSALFFKFVDALKKFKPKYFLLENVRMKKEYQDVISSYLGVEPIMINSSLVSIQNRVRLYWTNIPNVDRPEQKQIDYSLFLKKGEFISSCGTDRVMRRKKIFGALTASYYKGIRGAGRPAISTAEGLLDDTRNNHMMLTPLECERLQTIPDNYTLVPWKNRMMSNSQRYKQCGNGWTIDVISHILSYIKEN